MKVKYFLITPKGYELKQFNTKQSNLLDIAFEGVGYYNLDTFSPWLPSKYVIIYNDSECKESKNNLLCSELTKCCDYDNAMLVRVNKKYKTRDSYTGVKSLSRRDIKNFANLFDHILEVKSGI